MERWALIDAATPTLVWLLLAVVLVLLAVASAVRVVDPDERAVVIRLVGRAEYEVLDWYEHART